MKPQDILLVFIFLFSVYFPKGKIAPYGDLIVQVIWDLQVSGNTLFGRKRIQKLKRASDKRIFQDIGLQGNF